MGAVPSRHSGEPTRQREAGGRLGTAAAAAASSRAPSTKTTAADLVSDQLWLHVSDEAIFDPGFLSDKGAHLSKSARSISEETTKRRKVQQSYVEAQQWVDDYYSMSGLDVNMTPSADEATIRSANFLRYSVRLLSPTGSSITSFSCMMEKRFALIRRIFEAMCRSQGLNGTGNDTGALGLSPSGHAPGFQSALDLAQRTLPGLALGSSTPFQSSTHGSARISIPPWALPEGSQGQLQLQSWQPAHMAYSIQIHLRILLTLMKSVSRHTPAVHNDMVTSLNAILIDIPALGLLDPQTLAVTPVVEGALNEVAMWLLDSVEQGHDLPGDTIKQIVDTMYQLAMATGSLTILLQAVKGMQVLLIGPHSTHYLELSATSLPSPPQLSVFTAPFLFLLAIALLYLPQGNIPLDPDGIPNIDALRTFHVDLQLSPIELKNFNGSFAYHISRGADVAVPSEPLGTLIPSAITSDGQYVYVLTPTRLWKIGSGFGYTIQGRLYNT
eukprot:TRINITY_DN3620_c0_g1_i2.p1 TRINITY_DN3620_c0_g1~~TRINITY_DN3620_c0_g1_i2.p1  ORF type:complete len:498 (-),score=73.75 TRINITY_DN3620_c0_g1_i2:570-2063(-)